MTRKDYVKLAEAFNETRPRNPSHVEQWEEDRYRVMLVLAQDNPRFNRDRFIRATEA